jgi:hypothetical protein
MRRCGMRGKERTSFFKSSTRRPNRVAMRKEEGLEAS